MSRVYAPEGNTGTRGLARTSCPIPAPGYAGSARTWRRGSYWVPRPCQLPTGSCCRWAVPRPRQAHSLSRWRQITMRDAPLPVGQPLPLAGHGWPFAFPPFGAAPRPGQSALEPDKAAAVKLDAWQHRSIGKGHAARHAHVYAHGVGGLPATNGPQVLAPHKPDVDAPRLAGDSDFLRLVFGKAAMEIQAQRGQSFDADRGPVALDGQPVAARCGQFQGAKPASGLESRVPRLLTRLDAAKERLKSPINLADGTAACAHVQRGIIVDWRPCGVRSSAAGGHAWRGTP